MSNTQSPSPGAGWHVDPWNSAQLRYWDGHRWTEHTSVQVGSASVEAPRSPAVMSRRHAGFAPWSLGLGIAGAGLGGIPVMGRFTLLLGALAITFGVLGVVRSKRLNAGRKRAVWGIVLGALALPLSIVAIVNDAGSSLSEDTTATLEDWLSNDVGLVNPEVSCPAAPALIDGNTFTCLYEDADGYRGAIEVTVEDSVGSLTWELVS